SNWTCKPGRCRVTGKQAKVLAFIRARGEMFVQNLTTYQGRSVDPLVRDGYLKLTPCGECDICKLNAQGGGRNYHCYKTRVKAVGVK
ncbi:MAG: hypothetical protein ACREGR_01230, partial [Minisyncoccia bacterium]